MKRPLVLCLGLLLTSAGASAGPPVPGSGASSGLKSMDLKGGTFDQSAAAQESPSKDQPGLQGLENLTEEQQKQLMEALQKHAAAMKESHEILEKLDKELEEQGQGVPTGRRR